MRITIVAPPWLPVPPLSYGGTEGVIDTLARGLQEAGHEVLLAATGDSTCPVPTAAVSRESVGVGSGGIAAEIRHVVHAYEAAVDHRSDIVHDHTLVGPFYASRFPDLPVVTTNHGPFAGDMVDVYRAQPKDVGLIAISYHQASQAGDVAVAAVIHHGVRVRRFSFRRGRR